MQRRAGHNATLTTQQSNQEEEEDTVLTLELRPRRRIRWDNNVVDNERMNRKKSKSTCASLSACPRFTPLTTTQTRMLNISQKKSFGESSSEEDSSSDESTESDDEWKHRYRRRSSPRRGRG